MSDVAISRLEAPALDADIQAFSVLLRDCVEAGASIGFLAPFTALPHRGDVAKLMVSPRARRLGIARRLVAALEACAREIGLRTLVLDTVTGSAADGLYRELGWVEVGPVPDYALFPDGTPCSTTFFYKSL